MQPFHFKTYTDAPSQPEETRSDDAGFSGCCAPFCILRASWKIPHWSCFFGVPVLLLLRFHLRSPLLKWTKAWQAPKIMNGVHQNDPWTMPCLFATPKPFKFNTKQCFNHYAIRYKGSKKQRFQLEQSRLTSLTPTQRHWNSQPSPLALRKRPKQPPKPMCDCSVKFVTSGRACLAIIELLHNSKVARVEGLVERRSLRWNNLKTTFGKTSNNSRACTSVMQLLMWNVEPQVLRLTHSKHQRKDQKKTSST